MAVASYPGAAPNYSALIGGDPAYRQTVANANASGIQNQAGLAAAQNRAQIQYGYAPGASATIQGLAGDATRGGISTIAQLAKQYGGSQAYAGENLAARGLSRSGELGQRFNANLQAGQQRSYKASQDLTDYLAGLRSTYLQQQDTLRNQVSQARSDALDRVIAQIRAGTIGQGTSGQAPTGAPQQALRTVGSDAAQIPRIPALNPRSYQTGYRNL